MPFPMIIQEYLLHLFLFILKLIFCKLKKEDKPFELIANTPRTGVIANKNMTSVNAKIFRLDT